MTHCEVKSLPVWKNAEMSQLTVEQQAELWVVQRIHRICRSYCAGSPSEPCLEAYERHVSLLMGEVLTEAAEAWIELIVKGLRQGLPFEPYEQLLRPVD